jgi:hypothetical protein
LLFQGSDDTSGKIVDLCFGQRGFAALENGADKKRIFSRGDILASEKVGGFDGSDFRDAQ